MDTAPTQHRGDDASPRPADPTPKRRRHRPREETRALLLDAAAQLAIKRVAGSGTPHNVLADIRIRDVLDEVNRTHQLQNEPRLTTGAFYQIWADQTEFQYELLSYLTDRIALPGVAKTEAIVAEKIAQSAPFDEVIMALAEADLSASRESAEMYVTLGLGAMAPVELVQRAQSEPNARYIETFCALLDQAIEHGGKRLRPGRTLEDLAWAIEALEVGYLLRWRTHPEIPEHRDAHDIPAYQAAFLGVVYGFIEAGK